MNILKEIQRKIYCVSCSEHQQLRIFISLNLYEQFLVEAASKMPLIKDDTIRGNSICGLPIYRVIEPDQLEVV